jgi:hypothetical protein
VSPKGPVCDVVASSILVSPVFAGVTLQGRLCRDHIVWTCERVWTYERTRGSPPCGFPEDNSGKSVCLVYSLTLPRLLEEYSSGAPSEHLRGKAGRFLGGFVRPLTGQRSDLMERLMERSLWQWSSSRRSTQNGSRFVGSAIWTARSFASYSGFPGILPVLNCRDFGTEKPSLLPERHGRETCDLRIAACLARQYVMYMAYYCA